MTADPLTEDQIAEIISAVSAGEPIRRILREREISCRRWYGLLDASEQVAERYARAKTASLEAMADEIIDIADAREGDVFVTEDGRRLIDNEAVQRARLRVDTRKWIMSKLAPKKYGERVTQEHTGANGGPVRVAVEFVGAAAGGVPLPVGTAGR
jgi:hypothetical protein